MKNIHQDEPAEPGKLLPQSGIALLKAGASSNRIITNLNRLAAAYWHEAIIDLNLASSSKEQIDSTFCNR